MLVAHVESDNVTSHSHGNVKPGNYCIKLDRELADWQTLTSFFYLIVLMACHALVLYNFLVREEHLSTNLAKYLCISRLVHQFLKVLCMIS